MWPGFASLYGHQESENDPECIFYTLNTYQATFISPILWYNCMNGNGKVWHTLDIRTDWSIGLDSYLDKNCFCFLLVFGLFYHKITEIKWIKSQKIAMCLLTTSGVPRFYWVLPSKYNITGNLILLLVLLQFLNQTNNRCWTLFSNGRVISDP